MAYKLKVIDGETYLLSVDLSRMAKDLPVGTLVMCIGEIPHEGACIRRSGKNDHCHGCQPLIASTKDIEGVDKLEITNYDKTNIQEFCWSTDRFESRVNTTHEQLVKRINEVIEYDKIRSICFIKGICYHKEPTDFRFGRHQPYVWGICIDKEFEIPRFIVAASPNGEDRQVMMEINSLPVEQLLRVLKRLDKKSYKEIVWNTNY